jgi:cholesterol oxidase
LGTTYFLLRNQRYLPAMPALGTRFSGNGDVLAFVRGARRRVNGQVRPRLLDPSGGPVITTALRYTDGAGGFYIEDGGYPEFANWAVWSLPTLNRLRLVSGFVWDLVMRHLTNNPRSNIGREIDSLLGHHGTDYSMPLLGMGRDTPDGKMMLRGKYLDIHWNSSTSRDYLDALDVRLNELCEALGGELGGNPLKMFGRSVTVHPLGGCPMGSSRESGVVDEYGEVWGVPGLFIADGSVLPGPAGANPSLTIAALADRFADRFADG